MTTADDELASAIATLEEWGSLNRRLDTARLRWKESSAKAGLARETAERQAAEYEYLTLQARADADQRVVDGLNSQLAALGDVKGPLRAGVDGQGTMAARAQRFHSDPAV
jgi:hypothetical protein